MKHAICTFMFFVILVWFNFAVPCVDADQFIVESTNSSLPDSDTSSNFVIKSSGIDGKSCFAYRSVAGTSLVFGFGTETRLVSLPLVDLFTVAWSVSRSDCLLFYTTKGEPSSVTFTVVNHAGSFNTSENSNALPAAIYALSVIEDPTEISEFVIGLAYSFSNAELRFATARFKNIIDPLDDLLIVQSLDIVQSGDFHQYGPQENVSVVLLFTNEIWAGNLLPPGQGVAFRPTDSVIATEAIDITSRALSRDSGVLCYNTESFAACHKWVPYSSEIAQISFFDASIDRDTSIALAQLNRNKSDTALFSVQNGRIVVYQNGEMLQSSITLPAGGTPQRLAVTNADANNKLTLLVRSSSGEMHLAQIRHDLGTASPIDGAPVDTREPSTSPFIVTDPTSNNGLSDLSASPEGVQIGTIVPAVLIPVVVVAVGLVVLLVLLRRRKKRQGSLLHGKSRVEIAMESIDDRLKIPYKSLVFKKEIGAGSYGKVFVGEWKGTPVAIKVSSSVSDMDGFFDEARITVGLQQHPNVVQTFGVSLDGQLPCIVLEFCEGGSLDNRLFDSDVTMTQQQKVALIKGIARGLYHLHTNNIVHRDLAARNVLLNKSGTPKISDFGMSRVLKSEAEKGKTRTNYGPIRWMAPESLKELQYSTKSDVWSFGIVLYEIVSRNEPHIDIDPLEVAVKIKNESYHPRIPQGVDPVLSEIMLSCWQSDPNNRPSMEQICEKLNTAFPED